MKHLVEKITASENIGPGMFRLSVESRYVAGSARPGQFCSISSGDRSRILRRPISICSADRNAGTFDLVFQVRGAGTENISCMECGDAIDFTGPSGKGFDMSPEYGRIAVVGGGIGIFPLLFLMEESKAGSKQAFLGFGNASAIVLEKEFRKCSNGLEISTDDGSRGFKGFVTDLFKESLRKNEYDIVYTCGPLPMMKKVSELCAASGIPCQVSLEQRMGCGIGACLVCACALRDKDGGFRYGHVCKDGPVFMSGDVDWNEVTHA